MTATLLAPVRVRHMRPQERVRLTGTIREAGTGRRVIAFAECHGRPVTERRMAGLEVVDARPWSTAVTSSPDLDVVHIVASHEAALP